MVLSGIRFKKNMGFSAMVFASLGSLLGIFVLLIATSNPTNATSSTQTDLSVEIQAVIAMSLTNCDASDSSTISINLEPTPVGVFKSNCQTVNVQTNAPGYTLTAKSSSSTLSYLNPTTVTPTPTIASTTSTTTTPSVLTNNTWGFGVQDRLNFTGQTYAIDNASNTYSALPTTDTTIYQTDTFPLPETDHTFYYGTKLTTDTMAGTYSTTITYTAVGAEVPEISQEIILFPCLNMDCEDASFSVTVGELFTIPSTILSEPVTGFFVVDNWTELGLPRAFPVSYNVGMSYTVAEVPFEKPSWYDLCAPDWSDACDIYESEYLDWEIAWYAWLDEWHLENNYAAPLFVNSVLKKGVAGG